MKRIVISGAGGGVGASLAFNLLLSPLECDVVMIDERVNMVRSHLWDLEQVVEQRGSGAVHEGSPEDIAGADVLVVAAAAPLTVNTSRMVYLEANAEILASLLDRLAPDWAGVLIVVTNPVDVLCTWARGRCGLDRTRLLGYTLNDSLRLRTGVGRELAVSPGRVTAWTLGEHGDLAVPLWDRLSVDGAEVELTAEQRATVQEFIGGWYVRHVALDSGRSSTWTSGLGVSRMVRACVGSDRAGESDAAPGELWPASVMLEGEYGIDGISLSVPVTLGPGGARQIHEWELSESQLDGLRASSEFVRHAAASIG